MGSPELSGTRGLISFMDEIKREYVRVSAACLVLYRVLESRQDSEDSTEPEDSDFNPISLIEAQKIVSKFDSGGVQQDEQMLELLLWIDWKVNYLIKAQSRERDKKLFPQEGILSDLSGSGLCFSSERAEQVGTKLRLRLILPVLPFNEMSIDGTVIHSKQQGWNEDATPKYNIGVEYAEIKEDDREAIFRFIVKRERKLRLEQRARKGKS